MTRTYLNVPFAEKAAAKDLGARWDLDKKQWYVPDIFEPEIIQEKFGKWLAPLRKATVTELTDEFIKALVEAGLEIEGDPILDGKWQRTTVSTSKDKKALKGAYIGYFDTDQPNGFIVNHDNGVKFAWFPKNAMLSQEQIVIAKERASEEKKQREAELLETHLVTAARCEEKWALYSDDLDGHFYLDVKGVEGYGLKRFNDKLVVPLRDVEGKLWNLQYISEVPGAIKYFEKDAKKQGNFHVIGSLNAAEVVLFAEGYATAASLHLATMLPVVVVFDSGNYDAVLSELREKLEGVEKMLCSDDDVVTITKILGTLNKSKLKENLGLVNNITKEEVCAALDGNGVSLEAMGGARAVLTMEGSNPEEHGGFYRVSGEIKNEDTGKSQKFLINNPGQEKAWEASQKHDVKVLRPLFENQDENARLKLSDFNDLHNVEGRAAVRAQIAMGVYRETLSIATKENLSALYGQINDVVSTENKRYVGPVLNNSGIHSIQNVGKGELVAHPIKRLDRVPEPGEKSAIQYQDGQGKVSAIEKTKDRENIR